MIDSIKKNGKGILLMMFSSLCVCVGQLLWKLANDKGVAFLLFGFVFYGVGAVVMVLAYRYGKLSVLQPILSLNYVISIVLASVVLHEDISAAKFIGVLVIMIGVLLIAGGDNE